MSKKTERRSFTPEQKDAAVADLDAGMPVEEVIAKHGMSNPTLYTWRKKRRAAAAKKAVVVRPQVKGLANPVAMAHANRDALIFLRKAERELVKGIRDGSIDGLHPTHLLSLLALHSLQGTGS